MYKLDPLQGDDEDDDDDGDDGCSNNRLTTLRDNHSRKSLAAKPVGWMRT